MAVADQSEASRQKIVTTHGVLLEIGGALSKLRYRKAAVELLRALAMEPMVEIIPLTPDVYDAAFQLFSERQDTQWSLCDCVSFIVMKSHGIRDALSADEHFEQAGFRALVRRA